MPAKQHYTTLSDSELITRLKEGDHSAYTHIYNRYYYLMIVFAYKKLRDEELARDFVQEQFAGLWEKRENISPNGSFSALLYLTLSRRIIDYFIHQKVETKYLTFLKSYIEIGSQERADHLIRKRELSIYIEKQIASLPSKMRTIFELSRKENLSHREISLKLKTSEHNVSKQITNAIKILKTKLGSLISIFII